MHYATMKAVAFTMQISPARLARFDSPPSTDRFKGVMLAASELLCQRLVYML